MISIKAGKSRYPCINWQISRHSTSFQLLYDFEIYQKMKMDISFLSLLTFQFTFARLVVDNEYSDLDNEYSDGDRPDRLDPIRQPGILDASVYQILGEQVNPLDTLSGTYLLIQDNVMLENMALYVLEKAGRKESILLAAFEGPKQSI